MHFAAVDIGSPAKGNLGWWVHGPVHDEGGQDPELLVGRLVEAAKAGPLVLGFEAPLYVPAKRPPMRLLGARLGEGNRSWSAGAGTATIAAALAIVPWVMDRLGAGVPSMRAWQDWTRKPKAAGEVLVFEAFVSGGPSDGHVADAKAAAIAAVAAYRAAPPSPSALGDEDCFSLVGAALLHARVSSDLAELHRRCMVVRAAKMLIGGPRENE
jgi:hypothetical protein